MEKQDASNTHPALERAFAYAAGDEVAGEVVLYPS